MSRFQSWGPPDFDLPPLSPAWVELLEVGLENATPDLLVEVRGEWEGECRYLDLARQRVLDASEDKLLVQWSASSHRLSGWWEGGLSAIAVWQELLSAARCRLLWNDLWSPFPQALRRLGGAGAQGPALLPLARREVIQLADMLRMHGASLGHELSADWAGVVEDLTLLLRTMGTHGLPPSSRSLLQELLAEVEVFVAVHREVVRAVQGELPYLPWAAPAQEREERLDAFEAGLRLRGAGILTPTHRRASLRAEVEQALQLARGGQSEEALTAACLCWAGEALPVARWVGTWTGAFLQVCSQVLEGRQPTLALENLLSRGQEPVWPVELTLRYLEEREPDLLLQACDHLTEQSTAPRHPGSQWMCPFCPRLCRIDESACGCGLARDACHRL